MEIVFKKLDEIKTYYRNARTYTNNRHLIENSIREFGFRYPLLIDEKGVIISGHGRYEAAQSLKLDSVPCIVAAGLDKEKVKALRIADNKIADAAEWNEDKLKIAVGEIDFTNFDYLADDFNIPIYQEIETISIDDFQNQYQEKEKIESFSEMIKTDSGTKESKKEESFEPEQGFSETDNESEENDTENMVTKQGADDTTRIPFGDERDSLSIPELLNYEKYVKVVVNMSGGKDSIAQLIEVLKHVPKEKVECDYCRVKFDYPGQDEYIEYLASFFGVKINVLDGTENYFDKLDRDGFPTSITKWCNTGWKTQPMRKAKNRRWKEYGKDKVLYCIGTRKEESLKRSKQRRKGMWKNSDEMAFSFLMPIFDYTEEQVIKACNDSGVKMFYTYKHLSRLSCFICPEMGKNQYKALERLYPFMIDIGIQNVARGLIPDKMRSLNVKLLNNIVYRNWSQAKEELCGLPFENWFEIDDSVIENWKQNRRFV